MKRKAIWTAMAMIALAGSVYAGSWSSSGKWGETGGVTAKNFTVRNNVWGDNAGPQSVWSSWGNDWVYWGVWADHSGGGIKSYPHIEKKVGKNINNINWQGAWFAVNRPYSGAYNTSFDIWFNNHSIELMLWMNQQGAVGPIGSWQASATVGGHSWNIYRGWNGYNEVISFIRTGNTNNSAVDLKAIYNYIQNNLRWFNNPYLDSIQFGFEITNCPGGMVFENAGFSFWEG